MVARWLVSYLKANSLIDISVQKAGIPAFQRWRHFRVMNKLGIGLGCCSCSCSTVALYGKGILELPMTSLVEEFKCAKKSMEMTLS